MDIFQLRSVGPSLLGAEGRICKIVNNIKLWINDFGNRTLEVYLKLHNEPCTYETINNVDGILQLGP